MYQIIKSRGEGKTTELLKLAAKENAIFVCQNPRITEKISQERGIFGIKFISYNDFLYRMLGTREKYVVDEIEGLLHYINPGTLGYSLSLYN